MTTQTAIETLAKNVAEQWLDADTLPDEFYFRVEMLAKEIVQAITQATAELRAENFELKQIAHNLHWMARRYADGRCTYAPGMVNDAVRQLQRMGVDLNICAERTPWARDGMGPGYSGLSAEEYALGEPVDGWNGFVKTEEMEALCQMLKSRESELAQAKAQLAALRAVLQAKCDVDYHASDAIADSGQWEGLKEYCRLHNEALEVLGNTQATADAHDAKVREAAREVAIQECMGIAADSSPEQHLSVGHLNSYVMAKRNIYTAIQALLPQADRQREEKL